MDQKILYVYDIFCFLTTNIINNIFLFFTKNINNDHKETFTYDVRGFFGIFDLPTYPN